MAKIKHGIIVGLLFVVAVACYHRDKPNKGDERVGKVRILHAGLRSCEFVLEDTDTDKLKDVVFSDAVLGFSKKRGGSTGVAFVVKSDASVAAEVVEVRMASGEINGLKIDASRSACFDSKGVELAGVGWRL